MTAPEQDPLRACLQCRRTTVSIAGRGLCGRCYDAHKRAGTLPPRLQITGVERVLAWLDDMRGVEGCWAWPGAKTQGYGQIRVARKCQLIHRLAYETLVGQIPPGLHIDHLCHNASEVCSDDARCPHRACANPAHLEAVTTGTNTLRGHTITAANLLKTTCPQGHPYDGDNLYVHRKTGSRKCRECHRASDRRAYWRDKESAA